MKRVLIEAVILLLLAAIPAAGSAFYHADKIKWSEQTLAKGEVFLSTISSWQDVLWVDARSRADYEKDHIPGAVLLNEDEWDEQFPALLAVLKSQRPIVFYFGSESCQLSSEV